MQPRGEIGRLEVVDLPSPPADRKRYPNEVVEPDAFMNQKLRSLIDDFRTAQDLAIEYLHVALRIPVPRSGLDWLRNGHAVVLAAAKLPENSAVSLNPHGYGIDVIHPNFRVDFDYGPDGQIDCFDVWRLAVHRHHLTDAEPPVGPSDDVREWVRNALEQGELLTVPDTYQAFFQDPTSLRSPDSICGIG